MSPLIPMPPITWSAPVVALRDGIVLFIITFPPMFVFLAIPTPPIIWSAPVVALIDSIEL